MATQAQRSIRLTGKTTTQLNQSTGSAGEIFYDSTSQTLRLYTSNTAHLMLATRPWVIANTFNGDYNSLTNRPAGFNGDYSSLTNKPVIFNGNYVYLTNKPNLNAYATKTELTTALSNISLTGYATESYVGTAIANLVDTAPATLNTLNELAAALNDDANFASTVTTALADKAPIASPTFTGTVSAGGLVLSQVLDQYDSLISYIDPAADSVVSFGAAASVIYIGDVIADGNDPGNARYQDIYIGHSSMGPVYIGNSLSVFGTNISLGVGTADTVEIYTNNTGEANLFNSSITSVNAFSNASTISIGKDTGSLVQDTTTFTNISGTAPAQAVTQSGILSPATSGSGTGAMFYIQKTGTGTSWSGVTTIQIANPTLGGKDYAVGDTITISGNVLGGTSPANDLTFTVATSVSSSTTTIKNNLVVNGTVSVGAQAVLSDGTAANPSLVWRKGITDTGFYTNLGTLNFASGGTPYHSIDSQRIRANGQSNTAENPPLCVVGIQTGFYTQNGNATLSVSVSGTRVVNFNSSTSSTSTTTGALTVAGGVGISGAIYAGNIYSNGIRLTAAGGSNIIASAASADPDIGAYAQYCFTDLAVDLTINAPIGTPVDGSKLMFRVLDNGTARAITWNATYTVIGTTLPITTIANKMTYVGCIYNATNTRWDVVAVTTEA